MCKCKFKIPVIIITAIVICFSSSVRSQSSDSTFLREGAWALQFGIAGNFTLTSIQGATIAAKYQISDRNAIRGGVTITGSTSNGNSSLSETVADTGFENIPTSSSSSSVGVSFIFQYLWYMNPTGPIHFYIGLGPSFGYNYSHGNSDNSSTISYVANLPIWERIISSSNSNGWTVSGVGVVGVEWFASRWLSIRAEYSESVQYQWRSTTSSNDYTYSVNSYVPYTVENDGSTKTWSVNNSAIGFGLNVYW